MKTTINARTVASIEKRIYRSSKCKRIYLKGMQQRGLITDLVKVDKNIFVFKTSQVYAICKELSDACIAWEISPSC